MRKELLDAAARCAAAMGQFERARERLDQLDAGWHKMVRSDYGFWFLRARVLQGCGDLNRAALHLRHCIRLRPTNIGAWAALTNVYAESITVIEGSIDGDRSSRAAAQLKWQLCAAATARMRRLLLRVGDTTVTPSLEQQRSSHAREGGGRGAKVVDEEVDWGLSLRLVQGTRAIAPDNMAGATVENSARDPLQQQQQQEETAPQTIAPKVKQWTQEEETALLAAIVAASSSAAAGRSGGHNNGEDEEDGEAWCAWWREHGHCTARALHSSLSTEDYNSGDNGDARAL